MEPGSDPRIIFAYCIPLIKIRFELKFNNLESSYGQFEMRIKYINLFKKSNCPLIYESQPIILIWNRCFKTYSKRLGLLEFF